MRKIFLLGLLFLVSPLASATSAAEFRKRCGPASDYASTGASPPESEAFDRTADLGWCMGFTSGFVGYNLVLQSASTPKQAPLFCIPEAETDTVEALKTIVAVMRVVPPQKLKDVEAAVFAVAAFKTKYPCPQPRGR